MVLILYILLNDLCVSVLWAMLYEGGLGFLVGWLKRLIWFRICSSVMFSNVFSVKLYLAGHHASIEEDSVASDAFSQLIVPFHMFLHHMSS